MIIFGKEFTESDAERFWAQVKVGSKKECWPWMAGKNSKRKGFDYGVFYFAGRSRLVTRIALSLHLGREVTSPEVLHRCDNPPCSNPHHLVGGTHLDNMKDTHSKGRRIAERGVERYNAKLDDDKVREIRRLYALREKYVKYTYTYFARKYGVDRTLIKNVIRKKAWRHVI